MDDSRFDALAKALGSLASRRLTLGALLGGGLGRLGLAETEAKSNSGKCKPACNQCQKCDKGKCEKKNGKKVCKKGKCKPQSGTLCTVASGAGGSCQSGTCVITCGGGTTNCGGTCRNLQTDNANCGACGTVCGAGTTCCAGVCRNLQTDEANCGACGTVCTANQVCQAGSCFPRSTCPATPINICSPPSAFTPCSALAAQCVCGTSTEGNSVCVSLLGASCPPTGQACTTSATCSPGAACVPFAVGCCGPGVNICRPACPAPTAAGAAAAAAGDIDSPLLTP